MHDNRLTHTDLKPENILLVDSDFKVEQSSRRRREVGFKLHLTISTRHILVSEIEEIRYSCNRHGFCNFRP